MLLCARGLATPEAAPDILTEFYRAYDVYDWQAVGFMSSGPDAAEQGVLFDTSLRGNGNGGHTYGRDLPVSDRESIVEYLKTQ